MVFIIDTSGSMSGQKIEQAKEALKYCVNSLNKDDNFNIVNFSDSIEPYEDKLLNVNNEQSKKTNKFIDTLTASGGTNIMML